MLDPARFASADPSAQPAAGKPRARFYMAENDRMAGSVPVWDYGRRAEAPPQNLHMPENGTAATGLAATEPAAGTTSYTAPDEDAFGFFDLLDMINPLQHIPLVSTLYREVTGDEIKPVARVIGSTIFGGPAGGAAGMAGVIIEHETGRDIPGNVMAMVRGEDIFTPRAPGNNPQEELDRAVTQIAEREAFDTLPPSTLAFVDPRPATAPPQRLYYAALEDDRMAGA